MKKVLLVEDDLLLNQTLAFHLTTEGYEVISSYNAASSKDYLSKGKFDLIILDINLPDGSGFDLCKIWRGKTTTPIIFLTAKDMESDMLKGYELGAEDYITKPFHVSVFLKKVEVLLRKTSTKNIEHIYNDGNLFLNFTKRTAMLQGKNIELTTGEFYTKIDIIDEGIGIPEEDFGKIFQRFFREESSYNVEGVGIGLYLSREIIQRQEGYIKVASIIGEGSTFSVFLPNDL